MRKEVVKKMFVNELISCDVCGRNLSSDISNGIQNYNETLLEIQEAHQLGDIGGYGSVIGDGNRWELDICQHCLWEHFKNNIRIIDEEY